MTVEILEPKPFRVYQRRGVERLTDTWEHAPDGSRMGEAIIGITGRCSGYREATLEIRFSAKGSDAQSATEWLTCGWKLEGELFKSEITLSAGWYDLEFRFRSDEQILAECVVSPVGVGEVFLIAGQSYAENCNEAQLSVSDSLGRVTAYDRENDCWQVAHDPQPLFWQTLGSSPNSCCGTIWPPAMDALVSVIQVPVGMVNTALGGTSTNAWLPGQPLFRHLVDAGRVVGDFRFVLWQQGESDVMEKTDTNTYVERLTVIQKEASKEWGFEPTWLLAKSTMHPLVYVDSEGERHIRNAVDKLCELPPFSRGPDTDLLAGIGVNRASLQANGHFTKDGQIRAGLLWFSAIWENLLR